MRGEGAFDYVVPEVAFMICPPIGHWLPLRVRSTCSASVVSLVTLSPTRVAGQMVDDEGTSSTGRGFWYLDRVGGHGRRGDPLGEGQLGRGQWWLDGD